MAHILKIIPKGFRTTKKIQCLSCMENNKKNIQQRINCAAKVKQQLEIDTFEYNKQIEQSALASTELQKV